METTAAINSAAPVTAGASSEASKTIDKNGFLKILAAQLQSQDPTNPTSNTEFIAQLTQFNSLEQLQSMSDSLAAMALMQSAALIGKNAVAQSGGVNIEGRVESIIIKNSIPYAEIGGNSIPVSSITRIHEGGSDVK